MSILKVWDEETQKYVGIPAIKGDKGEPGEKGEQGPQGPQGSSYVLTASDKQTIAQTVYDMLLNADLVSY